MSSSKRTRPVIALLFLFAVACTGEGQLALTPSVIDFGETELLETERTTLLVENTGDGTLALTRFGLEAPSAVFQIQPPDQTTLDAGEQTRIGVAYTPAVEAQDMASLVVEADDGSGPHAVPVRGRGVQLGLEVELPEERCGAEDVSIAFGTTVVGQPVRRTIRVRSTGSGSLALRARAEPPTPEWSFERSFDGLLPAGEVGEITAIYRPQDAGADRATIVISSNARTFPETRIAACGEGQMAALCAVPSALSFRNIAANTATASTVRVESCGNLPVEVTKVAISSDPGHPSDPGFSATTTSTLPATLAPGSGLTLDVGYRAPHTSPALGYVELESNASLGSKTFVSLSANSPPPCDLDIVPAELPFYGSGPLERRVLVSNEGTDSCRVSRVELAPGPAAFALKSRLILPATLGPGASMNIVLEYLAGPSSGWPEHRRLEIEYAGDFTDVERVALVGNPPVAGCRLEPSPATVAFGTIAASAMAREEVYLANVGTEACQIHGAFLTPGSHSDLLFEGPMGSQLLPAGDRIALGFVYLPLLPGRARGSVTVDSTDAITSRLRIPLYGEAIERPSGCGELCMCDNGLSRTYRRFDTPSVPSAVFLAGQETPFHVTCEMQRCSSNEVAVEVDFGVYDCAPPPPTCDPGKGLEFENGHWDCVACELIIQYGGIFFGRRVCAPEHGLNCSGGKVPTFLEDKRKWECVEQCDGGLYDPRYLQDGSLVCIPC